MAEKKTTKTKSKVTADEAVTADSAAAEVAADDQVAAADATTDGADGARDPQQIEAEIEETREDLGDTVAALADRADVKKQAKQKVDETKIQAQEKATAAADTAKQTLNEAPERASQTADRALATARENPIPVAAGAVGLLAILLLWRRRRG